jgi:hypothetical protein
MFQKAELERLQQRKVLLVLESETNRLRLAEDWRRLSSRQQWAEAAGGLVRRHPATVAALAIGAGLMASRFLRKPGGFTGGLAQLGKMASTALSVWRLLQKLKP